MFLLLTWFREKIKNLEKVLEKNISSRTAWWTVIKFLSENSALSH